MIPSVVLSAADFVFLEAALAILGIGDPVTPTWGKVIEDAFYAGALFKGQYYWVLIPSALLAATSVSFALIGFHTRQNIQPQTQGDVMLREVYEMLVGLYVGFLQPSFFLS
jgi:peptide/nickel transport system permease protein